MFDRALRLISLLLAAMMLDALSVSHAQSAPAADAPSAADLVWRLPPVRYPADNEPSAARVALGRQLFFDPHLAKGGTMSCASCHDPAKGWSDGLKTGRGLAGNVLPRRTPSIFNAAYAGLLMWDGRMASLEDQALGPLDAADEMGADRDDMLRYLRLDPSYRQAFAEAYPGQAIGRGTLGKALASFERSIVGATSPFDRWLDGETTAMSSAQVRGFRLFTSPDKGNCAICHQAPTFSDDGFHNIGLASYGGDHPDLGRYAIKRVAVNKGAFRTPGLRSFGQAAAYFHDGSATTLSAVVEHYGLGGSVKTDLSQNIRPLTLTAEEKADLVAFLEALRTERVAAGRAPDSVTNSGPTAGIGVINYVSTPAATQAAASAGVLLAH